MFKPPKQVAHSVDSTDESQPLALKLEYRPFNFSGLEHIDHLLAT